MLINITETVSPGATAFTTPDIVKAIVLLSLLKTVIVIVAVRVVLEVFVTLASAPALPKSVLKLTDSNWNDLL
jgi:hypothetical protein